MDHAKTFNSSSHSMTRAHTNQASIRLATFEDVTALLKIEEQAFSNDRLSRRSFRRAITSKGSTLLVAENTLGLLGYALIHLRRGTRLARLYSLAVAPLARGLGIGKQLIQASETKALKKGKSILRLEVSDKNSNAIALYQTMGYREFGHYHAYYEDQTDAIRMQKTLHYQGDDAISRPVPWLAQGTPFTCGPAALQMVLSALNQDYQANLDDELEIWREATTIFMTSGHGGCHPLGLALAATKRGLQARVWLSEDGPLFINGVRDELKKNVMSRVHQSFVKQCQNIAIEVHYAIMPLAQLINAFDQGALAIILISTFRMDGKKAPHWVVMSGYNDDCILVHDPDYEENDETQSPLDCQYLPIARNEFEKMSRFGQSRLKATVVLNTRSDG